MEGQRDPLVLHFGFHVQVPHALLRDTFRPVCGVHLRAVCMYSSFYVESPSSSFAVPLASH